MGQVANLPWPRSLFRCSAGWQPAPRSFRTILILLLAVAIWAIGADTLLAAGEAEAGYLLQGDWRGPGFYLSWIKILFAWLLFLLWVMTTAWVSEDGREHRLDWLRWNPIVFGSFLGAFVLHWLIPWFWLGYPILLAAYAGPLTAYILYRNAKLPDEVKVMTPGHLRWLASKYLGKIGIKIAAEARDPNRGGAPVTVTARSGQSALDGARLLAARQCAGLPKARKILADGLSARASAIVLDFAQTTVSIRYMVDGVLVARESMEREEADPALEAMKALCGLDPKNRRARQEGPFSVEYTVIRPEIFAKVDRAEDEFRERTTVELTKKMASEELTEAQLKLQVARAVEQKAREKFATPVGTWTPVDREKLPKLPGVDTINPMTSLEPVKCPATLTTQGTPTGERVVLQFEVKAKGLGTFDDLGMRAKLHEQFKEVLCRPKGFVLLSAIPGGGLRTTAKVLLQNQDRFTREFISVEDEANRYEEVENVAVRTYKLSAGETPETILPKVFREEPNVLVVRDLVDAKSVSMLCRDIATEDRLVIGSMRAKDAAEAIVRVLALGVPPGDLAKPLLAVVAQRLLRKLCDKCKEAYGPTPEVLQQLGIPAGRVKAFYRPPAPKPTDEDHKETCRECGGTGYKGQTALFEMIVVDDAIRKAIAATPKPEAIRQAARASGMKSLQEEGILLVVRGVTSLPELMRVLK